MFRSVFFMVIVLVGGSYAASSLLAGRVAKLPEQQASGMVATAEPQAMGLRPTPSSTGYGDVEIARDPSGNYLTNAEIDGYVLRMVVDTGATYVCLTDADASAVGIRPAPADFRYRTQTANGVGVAAKVSIGRLRLGQVEITNVEAFVMPPGALATSLLGMSALNRLGKVEIASGRLILRQ